MHSDFLLPRSIVLVNLPRFTTPTKRFIYIHRWLAVVIDSGDNGRYIRNTYGFLWWFGILYDWVGYWGCLSSAGSVVGAIELEGLTVQCKICTIQLTLTTPGRIIRWITQRPVLFRNVYHYYACILTSAIDSQIIMAYLYYRVLGLSMQHNFNVIYMFSSGHLQITTENIPAIASSWWFATSEIYRTRPRWHASRAILRECFETFATA